jgi:hypothetical protein
MHRVVPTDSARLTEVGRYLLAIHSSRLISELTCYLTTLKYTTPAA